MSWTYHYDAVADETTIYWSDEKQATVKGKIKSLKNGYPATEEARKAIGEAIQSAGTPERIRMQFDFNYGFEEITPEENDE